MTTSTPSKNPKNELTARERELMAYAWLCFSEKPKVSLHLRPFPSCVPSTITDI